MSIRGEGWLLSETTPPASIPMVLEIPPTDITNAASPSLTPWL